MAYEQEKKDLAAQMWKRFSLTVSPLVSNKTLVRTIGAGAKGFDSKMLTYLDKFVDASNVDGEGNPVARPYVDNPQADQVPYMAEDATPTTGRWRLVENSWNPQFHCYMQTLRYGWSETLNWDEVRLAKGSDTDTTERGRAVDLTIIIPNVAQGSSQAIMKALVDGGAGTPNVWTDPVIQGVPRTGVWTCREAAADEHEEDGSHDIRAVLYISEPYNTSAVTLAENVFEKTEQTEYFNQDTVPVAGGWTSGVIRTISAAIDRLKKWRVSLRTTTSKYSLLSYSFTQELNGVAERHYICWNQATTVPDFSVLPALTAGFILDFASSPSRNEDGTWNWYAIIRPTVWGFGVGETITYKEGKIRTWTFASGGGMVGVTAYTARYSLQTQITVKMCKTVKEAIAFSSSGLFGCILDGMTPYHIIGTKAVLGYRVDSLDTPTGLPTLVWSVAG